MGEGRLRDDQSIEGGFKVVGEETRDPRPIWEVKGFPNSQGAPWTARRIALTVWMIVVMSGLRYLLQHYWGM